ncbi:MAG TPA: hypothetical protein VE134_01285, partial [Methanomicrobiales archaeon]|nr:hypothetical protein [Methanomicrobiales archaeon]
MPRIRSKTKIETYLAELSTEHPDDEYRILTGHRTDEGMEVVLEAKTTNPESLTQFLDEDPNVYSWEVIHADDENLLIQYMGSEPEEYRRVLELGVVPRYPRIIRNGWLI